MSSHALVQAALDAHAPLVALVGQRIRPDLAEATDELPFIVFKRASLTRHAGMDGTVLGETETFEIDCWGGTRSLSISLSELVLDALDAAGLTAETALPDGIDPEQRDKCITLSLDI